MSFSSSAKIETKVFPVDIHATAEQLSLQVNYIIYYIIYKLSLIVRLKLRHSYFLKMK